MGKRTLVAALLMGLMTTGEAFAAPRDWHLGVNLRTDLGTGRARLDGGVRTGRMDWIVIVDPIGMTGSQQDIDALASYGLRSLSGWRVFAGHRTTALDLDYGHGFHHKALVGFTGDGPSLGTRWLRVQWGVELAVNWLRHGAGLPDQWISFRSGRHFGDLVNFGFFARFEFASRI